jgi:hypothetical protein
MKKYWQGSKGCLKNFKMRGNPVLKTKGGVNPGRVKEQGGIKCPIRSAP